MWFLKIIWLGNLLSSKGSLGISSWWNSDQAKLEQVYDEPCEGFKNNLKLVTGGKTSMIQPWSLALFRQYVMGV